MFIPRGDLLIIDPAAYETLDDAFNELSDKNKASLFSALTSFGLFDEFASRAITQIMLTTVAADINGRDYDFADAVADAAAFLR